MLSRPSAESPPATGALVAGAQRYLEASRAPNTLRAYRADLEAFTAWCDRQGTPPLPATPETVTLYVSSLADGGSAVATIRRRLAAISIAHQAAGLPTPTSHLLVRTAMAGIRRTLGVAQRQVAPLVTADLRAILAATPDGTPGVRDRALRLLARRV